MGKIDLAGKLDDARARVEAEAPPHERGLAKFARLTRKDARVRADQDAALTALVKAVMRQRSVKAERITENTLIRVAIDLLLAHADELRGSTEDELRESVTSRLPNFRSPDLPTTRTPALPGSRTPGLPGSHTPAVTNSRSAAGRASRIPDAPDSRTSGVRTSATSVVSDVRGTGRERIEADLARLADHTDTTPKRVATSADPAAPFAFPGASHGTEVSR